MGRFSGATRTVNEQQQDSRRTPANQGVRDVTPKPNKISASTPYDFEAKSLTAYGGLLPVASMLEKLGFQQLVEDTLTVKRKTKAMTMYQFVLGMVLACYVGSSRLYQFRFLEREPMLTGILSVLRLPPQSTFWRFLASLHLGVAKQLLQVHRGMRERVWAAANVQLTSATLDTDTTVHTLFGNQMGARKSYNPKKQGQEELPTDSHLPGRNQGVRSWRAPHWRSAQRERNSGASGQRVRRSAIHREDRLRTHR